MINFKHLVREINAGETVNNIYIQFRQIQGYKGQEDKILQLNTFGRWINITIPDILTILDTLFQNEDKVYPISIGKKGRWFLFDLIYQLAHGHSVDELMLKYGDKHDS